MIQSAEFANLEGLGSTLESGRVSDGRFSAWRCGLTSVQSDSQLFRMWVNSVLAETEGCFMWLL